jgi:hypothetical protein
MAEPRVSFGNRMYRPQPMDAEVADQSMSETGWTSLAYGFASRGYLKVYDADNTDEIIGVDRLYDDAVSLSLGIFTIKLPHLSSCNRFICNCKIM